MEEQNFMKIVRLFSSASASRPRAQYHNGNRCSLHKVQVAVQSAIRKSHLESKVRFEFEMRSRSELFNLAGAPTQTTNTRRISFSLTPWILESSNLWRWLLIFSRSDRHAWFCISPVLLAGWWSCRRWRHLRLWSRSFAITSTDPGCWHGLSSSPWSPRA